MTVRTRHLSSGSDSLLLSGLHQVRTKLGLLQEQVQLDLVPQKALSKHQVDILHNLLQDGGLNLWMKK